MNKCCVVFFIFFFIHSQIIRLWFPILIPTCVELVTILLHLSYSLLPDHSLMSNLTLNSTNWTWQRFFVYKFCAGKLRNLLTWPRRELNEQSLPLPWLGRRRWNTLTKSCVFRGFLVERCRGERKRAKAKSTAIIQLHSFRFLPYEKFIQEFVKENEWKPRRLLNPTKIEEISLTVAKHCILRSTDRNASRANMESSQMF